MQQKSTKSSKRCTRNGTLHSHNILLLIVQVRYDVIELELVLALEVVVVLVPTRLIHVGRRFPRCRHVFLLGRLDDYVIRLGTVMLKFARDRCHLHCAVCN